MAPTSGRFLWGILLCKFSDQPNKEPKPPQFFRDLISSQAVGNLAAYWKTMSYGKLDMSNPDVYGWLKMPFPLDAAFRKLTRAQKTQKCIDAAPAALAGNAAALKQLSLTTNFLVVINEIVDSGSDGLGRILWGPDTWFPTYIAHEMGHVLGLDHSFDTNTVPWDAPDDGRPGAYGESLDIMSAMNFAGLPAFFQGPLGFTGPGLNANNRDKLGWIPAEKIFTLHHSVGGTPISQITVAALDNSNVVGHLLLKIICEGVHNGAPVAPITYLVEFRPQTGMDQGISKDAIAIHMVRPGDFARIVWHGTDTQCWSPNDRCVDLVRQIAIEVVGMVSDKSTAAVSIRGGPGVTLPVVSLRKSLGRKFDLAQGLRAIHPEAPFRSDSVRERILANPPQLAP
jgi:hypothetical protein